MERRSSKEKTSEVVRWDGRNAISGYVKKVKMKEEVTDKKAVTESGYSIKRDRQTCLSAQQD